MALAMAQSGVTVIAMARGHITRRANGTYRVYVYAGKDPLTGKQRYLNGTAPTQKEAEKVCARLLTKVDEGKRPVTRRTVAEVIEAWLEVAELGATTRHSYEGYIRRQILPTLGNMPARKLDIELLERFYARLRKQGGTGGKPMANSSVRQIHFILRAALGQAVKWGWLAENPAALATPPRFTWAEIQPPSVEGVNRLLDIAWEGDPDLGTLLWVAIISGVRRGELCGLRWPCVRLAEGDLLVSRNTVQHGSVLVEKDTKTHQARRIALDELTVEILGEHRQRCVQRAQACGVELLEDGYVFSSEPDGSVALKPHSVTQRVRRVARKAGVDADLRRLRHFMGTVMLTEGTDLRTVAGRLGHAGGGATTLRVYTHFLPAPDRRAAEQLAKRLGPPRPPWSGQPDTSATG
jgi:integrase